MEPPKHAPDAGLPLQEANDGYVPGYLSSPDPLGSTGPSESSAASSSSSQPDQELAPFALDFFDEPRGASIVVKLPSSTLVNPKSAYDGYEPPLPPTREHVAVEALMATTRSKPSKKKFVDFELSEFTFYADPKNYPKEMRSLHQFSTKTGHDKFYFDGVLSAGEDRYYVSRVEVCELPIGNYGTEHASVDDQIWVRSTMHKKRDLEVYYRLTKPAHEYKRFFYPFLWVANLAKHVVDFFAAPINENRDVHMGLFRHEFFQWLLKTHGEPALKRWLAQHPSRDFRTSIMANLRFIWKESNGVLGHEATSLTLFREAMYFNEYPVEPTPTVPLGGMVRGDKGGEEYPTIVTPYIMECFGHMVIGKMLRLAGEDATMSLPSSAATELGMAAATATQIPDIAIRVQVGDVISTPRDGEDSDTKWKPIASRNFVDDGRWFGLVQRVHVTPRGRKTFDITWLYRPSETPCCVMKYPWPNELFLSDHCTCEEGASARIQEHQVIDIHPINWFGGPNDSGRRLFIRQFYMVEERRWVTLQPNHLRCAHDRKKLGYKVGDTLLVPFSDAPDAPTEPVEVIRIFKQVNKSSTFVRLRRFRRRTADRADAPKNELVWTEEYVVKKTSDLHPSGKCHIRFFASTELIPSPYNRGGTGNLFFITHRDMDGKSVPFDGDYPPLKQGFDPGQEVTKLKGLDLFCGAGNFGRGLEDGGVVDMCWTNDIWDRAIHTYMANQPDKDSTHAFLGSVDYLLQAAIEGNFSKNVPRPGEVDFISAGSPCPGFSLLTQDKTTLHQIKNQSLVASFAAFVDFYRPKYGVLENVASIVQAEHKSKEDVLSQLFCALIGMGYQAQLILGDAWAHGAPQSRTRVFLYFAAPGLRLPEAPLASHSHWPKVRSSGLGKMCNGEPFVRREFGPTAFKYVSVEEAAGDLPEIGDAKPDSCVAFPDHRVSVGMTSAVVRGSSTSKGFGILYQIPTIPIHPYGLNFAKAWKGGHGVMSKGDRALFPEASSRVGDIAQGWSRVHPRHVFQTVTTSAQPTCARTGSGLHWNQPRPLSLMEVRRAQGFLDDEVLVGSTAEQWKLVGNSVARPMALALGLKFREAWLGSLGDGGGREPTASRRPPVATTDIQAIVDRARSGAVFSGSSTPSEFYSVEDVGGDGEGKGDDDTPATVVSDLEVPSRRKRTHSREPSVAGSDRPAKQLRRQLDEEDPKMLLLSRLDLKARRESESRSRSVSMAPGWTQADVVTTTTVTTTTTTTLATATRVTMTEPMEMEPMEMDPMEMDPMEEELVDTELEEPLKINGMTIIRID
ncbi:hypothetical protein QBC39DRAFT_311308 [Podospora conica]|nr:hypothetical protein QBC39DRAFT_311308 [Schizothecium conicum]